MRRPYSPRNPRPRVSIPPAACNGGSRTCPHDAGPSGHNAGCVPACAYSQPMSGPRPRPGHRSWPRLVGPRPGRGKAAPRAIGRENPAVILTDQMMPDVDGLSFVHLLRANPTWADVRVIVVSATSAPDAIDRALRAGANDYLVKPFSAR